MDVQSILKSKLATVGLVLFLLMVAVGSSRLFLQKYEVDREIQNLEQKASEIQRQNDELAELIKYLNTKEYTERAARDKLNLKKEGEIVVSVPERTDGGEVAGSAEQKLSNAQRWYNYFFRTND